MFQFMKLLFVKIFSCVQKIVWLVAILSVLEWIHVGKKERVEQDIDLINIIGGDCCMVFR